MDKFVDHLGIAAAAARDKRSVFKEPVVSAQTPKITPAMQRDAEAGAKEPPTTATPTTAEPFHKRAEKRASPAEIARMRQRMWNIRGVMMAETAAELLAILADAEDAQADSLRLERQLTALQEAVAQVRTKIGEIDRPWHAVTESWHGDAFVCDWCHATWGIDRTTIASRYDDDFAGYEQFTEHPANDCLWLSRLPASPVETLVKDSADNSVILAAEAYAQRCVEATGQKFDISALVNLKAWFYAGARWRDARPNADVNGPVSLAMASPVETEK